MRGSREKRIKTKKGDEREEEEDKENKSERGNTRQQKDDAWISLVTRAAKKIRAERGKTGNVEREMTARA